MFYLMTVLTSLHPATHPLGMLGSPEEGRIQSKVSGGLGSSIPVPYLFLILFTPQLFPIGVRSSGVTFGKSQTLCACFPYL